MIKTLAELLANATRAENGCLLWNGPFNTRGYGIVHSGKRHTTAHRIVLELSIGRTLSRQEYACHHCDTPPCIEPAHLFAGSPSDNMQDCLRKSRLNTFRSEEHRQRLAEGTRRAWSEGRLARHSLKLSEAQVIEIRALAIPQKQIAARYGVVQSLVSQIKCRKVWAHV